MTPLDALITALAYVMRADSTVSAAEHAQLVALLSKHVDKGELDKADVKKKLDNAFAFVDRMPFDQFMLTIQDIVTPGQALSIYTNLCDAMYVDGSIAQGERQILDAFRKHFEIDVNFGRILQEVLMLRNDTTMFTRMDHPCNEPGWKPSFMRNA